MSKRHPSLVPLTHDHHHTLAQVGRLKETRDGDSKTLRRAADDFVNFYLGRGRHHFREEEELFFAPLIDDEVAGPMVGRAIADHLRVHALLRTIRRQLSDGEVSTETLAVMAELLEKHVRFEEQQLFPLIETRLSDDELTDLATSGRRDV